MSYTASEPLPLITRAEQALRTLTGSATERSCNRNLAQPPSRQRSPGRAGTNMNRFHMRELDEPEGFGAIAG